MWWIAFVVIAVVAYTFGRVEGCLRERHMNRHVFNNWLHRTDYANARANAEADELSLKHEESAFHRGWKMGYADRRAKANKDFQGHPKQERDDE